ncbi:hypothetical protein K523DRAFT_412925 [Schizophyllum commune Tattone D]|nr:hypothetical protein K523DRAFT_412925 [Schizophyllum commune Tattone D]
MAADLSCANAKAVIQTIRRARGVDVSREVEDAMEEITGMLHRALSRLSDDLYSTDTHFVLEFIQNADDNAYAPGVVPELHIECQRDGVLAIKCNETGFTEKNVRALCDIGTSTKVGQRDRVGGYTGEKGIGFKAVFKAGKQVFVTSNSYNFKFDRDARLGMITPAWDETYPTEADWTAFHIVLSSSDHTDLHRQLDDIGSHVLLFLRRLRSISISIHGRRRLVRRDDLGDGFVDMVANGSSRKFLVVDHEIDAYRNEPKRPDVEKTVIVLAFAVDGDGLPDTTDQMVNAYLPVRDYGLPFTVQADWLTPASREDISNKLWNKTLRNNIAPAFVRAVSRFLQVPSLKFSWLAYVPMGDYPGFMHPLRGEVINALRDEAVIFAEDGTLHPPTGILICPSAYRDSAGAPLIPQRWLKSKHYISSSYDLARNGHVLSALGVRTMGDDDFLRGLRILQYLGGFSTRCADWHSAVWQRMRSMNSSYDNRKKSLRLIPLHNGVDWVSVDSASNVYLVGDLAGEDLPKEVGVKFARSDETTDVRDEELRYLGMPTADADTICRRLVQIYSQSTGRAIPRSSLDFLYRHYSQCGSSLDYSSLRLRNATGGACCAWSLYMDDPRRQPDTIPLSSFMGTGWDFLHSSYVDGPMGEDRNSWTNFLIHTLKVRTQPRNDQQHEIVRHLLTLPSNLLLGILKDYWSTIGSWPLQPLRTAAVMTSTGEELPLQETYLPTEALRGHSELPFLSIPSAATSSDLQKWTFLTNLGVTSKPGPAFYRKRLIALSRRPLTVEKAREVEQEATQYYTQLQSRFNDSSASARIIRAAFADNPLIFHRHASEWLSLHDVYWSGPHLTRSRVLLKNLYPTCDTLFHDYLGVQDCPQDILATELIGLGQQWELKAVPHDDAAHASSLLLAISRLVDRSRHGGDSVSSWISGLRDACIFPVQHSTGETRLMHAGADFYVPDPACILARRFLGRVPILFLVEGEQHLDVPMSADRLLRCRPLLDHPVFSGRLRNLQDHASESFTCAEGPSPPRYPQAEEELIKLRFGYVKRFLLSVPGKKDTLLQSFALLDDIQIHLTSELRATYAVDGLKSDSVETDLAVVGGQAGRPTRLIVSAAASANAAKVQLKISQGIIQVLGASISTSIRKHDHFINLIFLCPLDALDEVMLDEGIQKAAPYEDSDKDHPQSSIPLTSHAASRPSTTRATAQRVSAGRSSSRPSQNPHRLPPVSATLADGHDEGLQSYLAHKCEDVSRHAQSLKRSDIFIFEAGPAQTAAQVSISMSSRRTYDDLAISSPNLEASGASDTPAVRRLSSQRSSCSPAASVLGSRERVGDSGVFSLSASRLADSRPTDVQAVNGILGETFVYHFLRYQLPGFTVENWTSEIRALVDGMGAFAGSAPADFAYHDTQGMLTGIVFGADVQRDWVGAWPTYYLEVKTTSGGRHTAFHMSASQLRTARELATEGYAKVPPKHVYVLVHVTDIRGEPQMTIIKDPHRSLYTGDLHIVSDVEVARA